MATSYEDRRGALLTQQPEQSPSRPFVTGALELLESLSPPRLTAYGFAFFDVLQLAEIRLTNGTHLTDSTHTLDDVAHVVAAYFATTEEQEVGGWWKERHASSLGAIEVRAARKWYGVALLKCPAVKEVRLFF
jgi:hypothetical protein